MLYIEQSNIKGDEKTNFIYNFMSLKPNSSYVVLGWSNHACRACLSPDITFWSLQTREVSTTSTLGG